MTDVPTMADFVWTRRTVSPAMRSLPGDLWCVRDAFSALMKWERGSKEWYRFIELPDPADMERLIQHLGLVAYDLVCPDHLEPLCQALDRPGITCYNLHQVRMSHCIYQPHLRHLRPLPPQYRSFDPQLFQVVVDLRQAAHTADCQNCQGRHRPARHPR